MIDNMQHCHRRNLNVFLILIVKPNSVWLWLRWLRECYMEAFEWLCSVQYQKFVFNRPTTAKLHPRQRILDGLHFKYILFLRNHVQDYSDATGWWWWWWRQTDVRGSLAWSPVSDSTLLQANCILDVALYVQCVLNTVQCKLNVYVACTLCNAHCTLRTAVEMCRVGRRGCTSMSGQSQPQVRACPSLHCSAQFCIWSLA